MQEAADFLLEDGKRGDFEFEGFQLSALQFKHLGEFGLHLKINQFFKLPALHDCLLGLGLQLDLHFLEHLLLQLQQLLRLQHFIGISALRVGL